MYKKIYRKIGAGKNLAEALIANSQRQEHHLITDWVECQQEAYMELDWDFQRIQKVIWDLKDQTLINFLTRIKVEVDTMEQEYDRKWLKKILRRKMTFQELKSVQCLMSAFNKDMEYDRVNWAYERAWEDFNHFWEQDVDKENDLEVAQFFGLKEVPEIEAVEIEDQEYDISEVEFCVKCGEPTVMKNMAENKEHYSDELGKDSEFYCSECGEIYKYDRIHCQKNPHVDPKDVMSRVV